MTSPYGNDLHHNENATVGSFAFTTQESGNYLACFWVDNHHGGVAGDVNLNLDWKIGVAAKDWDSVARKEKIEVNILMNMLTNMYCTTFESCFSRIDILLNGLLIKMSSSAKLYIYIYMVFMIFDIKILMSNTVSFDFYVYFFNVSGKR